MKALKPFIPPVLISLKKKIFMSRYGWFGDFKTWDKANSKSAGYDADTIFEKVLSSTLAVKRGEAAYERDSFLFYDKDVLFHMLTGLLLASTESQLKLNVMDFGGALGSTYFQHVHLLKHLELSWHIVEQQKFVNAGKLHLEDETLKFHHTIESCVALGKPNVVLLSSVLAYIPDPYQLLEEIFALNIPYLLIDKHPLIEDVRDRITIQRVPPEIYHASYPAWFFSKKKFYDLLDSKYEIVYKCQVEIPNDVGGSFWGIFARLK